MGHDSQRASKLSGLQKQHDLLNEKIERLRVAHAIETSAAIRFQLEKQIEQAESERSQVEQRLDSLDDQAKYAVLTEPEASTQVALAGPQEQMLEHEPLIQLRQLLVTHFDEGELRTLCFDLDVDCDSLPGEGKANKARELVSYLQRRNQILDLVQTGRRLRPNAPWPDMSEAASIVARQVCRVPQTLIEKHGQNIVLLPRASVESLKISKESTVELRNRVTGQVRFSFAYSIDRVCDVSIPQVLRSRLGVSLSGQNDIEIKRAEPREWLLVHEVCKTPADKIRRFGQNVVALSSAIACVLDVGEGEIIKIVNQRNGAEKPVTACSTNRVCEVGIPAVLRRTLNVQIGPHNELILWRT